ncbi:alpha/beta hydrolase [Candidatus Bathyarchaeota archaeon]|nr:alpha/beta hydrolase [Candidatus Bathyarchaeota archaeon]
MNYVEGPDDDQPIILIPGQGGTWESYNKVLKPLSERYKVYAVDVRGHGKSSWTTGEYNFNNIGEDFIAFIEKIVQKPVIVSGNSSGGLIALWLSVNKPELVKGIVLEDAPLFSADWPRIKSEFVYDVLDKTATYLGDEKGPDYEGFLKSIKRPTEDGKYREVPGWMINIFVWIIKRFEKPGKPLDIPFLPSNIRDMLRTLSTFDPDFSRSWVDGRIYEGLNHEDALSRVKCPILIIHADWYRTEKGLVGAMDDNDATHALELAPHAEYVRLKTVHQTHSGTPDKFVELINNFIEKIR